jgi:signal transduction histidine kinase
MTAKEQRQLNRLLTALAGASEEREGLVAALPAIASMLGSDGSLVWAEGEVRHKFGPIEPAPLDNRAGALEFDGRFGAVAPLLDDGYLMVARPGSPYDAGDLETLIGFASALDLFLRMWKAREIERLSAERGHRQAVENVRLLDSLIERQRLFERLTRIQRSISHRAPLQEVLDAVCYGARELIGDEVVGVRLIAADDPDVIEVKADVGLSEELREKVRWARSGVGVGGRAFKENRLVIVYEYDRSDNVVIPLKEGGLQSAMAAPVHEHGQPVGSLVVSTYKRGRRYSQVEQEVLLAFAEHVSIALTDAKTVEALREAQRVKEMFLAMVSHELKTPLTAIMGTLRTFQRHDSALRGELRETMLNSAVDRGEQLAHLINRLLIGARAELANIEQDITLRDLVNNSVKGFRDMGILDVGEIPDLTVRTDAGSIQGALGILLENAIAHSPTGSPIKVRATADDYELSIAVSNEGSLPEELDAGALFQPFQRGADARSSGVGLGLYIALRLAEASGGTIQVESLGGHVTFDLRVPLKLSQPTTKHS